MKLLACGMAAMAIVCVCLALTPSHYARVLAYLGADIHPWLFSTKADRSDEYFVLTPLIQTAVRGGFSETNQISPYRETLKGFLALPILDWSLLFKPQLWGFWILPPAYAYSVYFCFFWAAFLTGYTILLTQLGARPVIAALGAVCLLYSGFVQAWWTTNAPTFAFAPWPAIVFLLKLRPLFKLPLLAWTITAWVFALVYPPFIVSGAFALGILLIAFRRDAFTPANCLLSLAALAIVAFLFRFYFGDLITIMGNTIYPGQRVSSGGGVDPSVLISHLFPYFALASISSFRAGNFCGLAAVSTFLPLSVLCFIRFRSARETLRANLGAWSLVALGLLLMLAWMVLPVPADLGRMLLWTNVPPYRMLWGFGLLLTLSAIILLSKAEFDLSRRRLWLFAAAVTFAGVLSKILQPMIHGTGAPLVGEALFNALFDWVPILAFPLILGTFSSKGPPKTRSSHRLVFASACVGAITFGTYNPVQPAFPIFDIPETSEIADLRRMAQLSPNGWAARPWGFGAILSGIGIPAVNHTLTTPQVDFFRKVFPSLPDRQLNELFNRYAHIVPVPGITQPYLIQDDAIAVPMDVFKQKIGGPALQSR